MHQSQDPSMDQRDLVSQLILDVFLTLTAPSPKLDDQGIPAEETGDKDMGGASLCSMSRNVATGRKSEFKKCAGESVNFDSQDKDNVDSSMESQLSVSGCRSEEVQSEELAEDSTTTIVAGSVEGSGLDSLSSSSFSRQMYINSPSPGESSKCHTDLYR